MTRRFNIEMFTQMLIEDTVFKAWSSRKCYFPFTSVSPFPCVFAIKNIFQYTIHQA